MSAAGTGVRYMWLLVLGLSVHATHFRGGIIMVRPSPGGGENEMEITFHVSWRRSSRAGGGCSATTIANGNLIGQGQLDCQYGCPSRVRISSMLYRCTDFSEAEDWSYGERRLAYNFSGTAPITIGFTGGDWISPFNSRWNLSTTFSITRRNDTGRINSTPRATTAPVIYVQEGCNHTISIAVNDPDDDIVGCRWAQGVECGGICNQFPGAELNPESCSIKYQANRGIGFRAAAIMIEDFTFNSTSPLSSVALQFLVLVVRSNEPCSSKPEFIPPTISQGACIAIPPSTTFNTTLVATSGGPDISIREIQTVSPIGVQKGALHHVTQSSSYYVNITWTPTSSQQNQTHSFCYTALNSAGVSSEQTCIEFFPGEFPPTPLQATAMPNGSLVHPSDTTWHIEFDTEIQRPTVIAFITFHECDTNREVYKIDTASSSEVTFIQPNEISITPRYVFQEETNFYINLERGVVRGIRGCKPGNEPLKDKDYWTFETQDVTPPVLWFIARPSLSNANVTFSWASNEVVMWACMLIEGATVLQLEVNCSEAYWRGIGLTEGTYTLRIEAADESGNVAQLSHTFEVDLTPPTTSILYNPASVSNEERAFFRFRCSEFCSLECQFVAGGVSGTDLDYSPCNSGQFTTVTLQHDSNYTFSVRGTDRVGNKGEAVSYMWETDFEHPIVFGVRNRSVPCTNNTSPDQTGQAQATDNREETPSVMYRDLYTNCVVNRTWSATDIAGNTGYLVQYITLDFSPSISLLPVLSYQCDGTSVNPIQVPTNTASSPNPCRRPLQFTYEDSIENYMCPGIFNRTWTVLDICNQKNTSSSQTISLYDVCPLYACGRNETAPHGVCTFGTCQCNSPWFGDDCNTLVYGPQIELVNDVVLQEAEDYTENLRLTQGTPPLSWSLLLGPDQLAIDQLSGQITWRRAQAGNYTISVQADNRAGRVAVTWSLCVKAGYNATLDILSSNTYPGAQPVQLTGHVQYKAGNVIKNLLASVVPVSIDITSEQTTRLLKTFTNSDGDFSTIFYPAQTEYGMYTARARHPSTVFQSMAQTQWQFLGMKATPRLIRLNGETIGTYEKTFYNATIVINDGPAALHNLRAIPVLGNIVGLHVQVQLNSSVSILQPGDSVLMNINIETTGAFDAVFPIRLETMEGTTLYLSVNLRIAQILPSFVVSPPSVNSRIIRGSSNIFQFNVTNIGRIEATSVRVLLPTTDFISFISFGTQQQVEGVLTIESRESALLSILVQTPSNQQLGDISGNLIISSTETSKRVPFTFTVSSNVQMNFTVRVEDEYTYFAEGQPLVNDAVVRLVNHQRNIRLTKSTEEDNGTATFINIPEDRYELLVEAPDHQSINQIVITFIDTPVLTVFIQRQAVNYRWSVSPTTFEDTYTITLEADFETRVPQPVVTVTPTEIELEQLELGLVDTLQFNITNHGLIRAEDLQFELPNDHPFLKFTTNANNLGSVEPLSSIIVPVQISRKTREKRGIIQVIYVINIVYSYLCGELRFRRIPSVIKKQAYRPDEVITRCGGPSSGCGVRGGGGGFNFNGFSASTPAFCNKCLQSVLNCIPTPKFPGAGCIPLSASGASPIPRRDNIMGVWSWINCALSFPWPSRPGKTFSRDSKLGKIVQELGPVSGWLNCFTSLYMDCKSVVSNLIQSLSESRRRRSVTSMVNDLTEAMYPIHLSIVLGMEVLGDELWINIEDPKWLSNVLRPTVDDESDSGVLISRTELSTILSAPLPNGTTIEAVTKMVERMNNTLFGWNNGQLEPQHTSPNMASYSTVQELTQDINAYQQKAQEKGFSSYLEAYNFAANELNKLDSWEDETGVCAVVRIRVEQELAVTREAFLAKLEIENNEGSSLEKITVEIVITDTSTAEEATSRFSIGNSTLSGSLSSDLSLPSGMSGSAEWLIVPYSEAAPTSNRIYDVGGVLSYTLNGEEIVIPLLPTKITVIPDPSLLVHYFWEKYVVGDDPFTEEREPSVPFTLGVAVKNSGYGTAYNLHITSAQPEIIENEKGLLVTFRIIGANVGRESISPSLTVNFDDIAPNTTKVARWYMVSSLQGEFKNYSATFENVNPLGDPKLSILDELKIHELIRNVHIYNEEENDEILDFLVNEQNNLSAYPDALYSSKTLQQYNVTTGEILSVQSVESGSMSIEVQASSNSSGWTYFRYEDTQSLFTSTALAVNFTKNEGSRSVSLPPENCWVTRDRQRRRNNAVNKQPFYLHILDYIHDRESVVYTLNLCTFDCRTEERPYEPVITVTAPTVIATPTLDITTTLSFPIPTLGITTPPTFTTPSPDVTTITPTPVTMVMTPTPVTATPLPTALELQCEREVVGDRLVVSGCTTNRPAVTLCSFEQQPPTECVFPVDIDLSRQPPGVYSLEINATDIFNLHDTSVISYTKPPLQVTFMNSSPRVSGKTIIADFTINRPTVSMECRLSGQPSKECSSGSVRYDSLSSGTYILRIVARAVNGEKDIERRKIHIGSSCSVHLINEGVVVNGHDVTIQFLGGSSVQSYLCKLGDSNYHSCRSPIRYNLAAGNYHFQVFPQGCGRERRKLSVKFDIQE